MVKLTLFHTVHCDLHCIGGRQRCERIPGYLSRMVCLPLLARVRAFLVELYFIILGLSSCVINCVCVKRSLEVLGPGR